VAQSVALALPSNLPRASSSVSPLTGNVDPRDIGKTYQLPSRHVVAAKRSLHASIFFTLSGSRRSTIVPGPVMIAPLTPLDFLARRRAAPGATWKPWSMATAASPTLNSRIGSRGRPGASGGSRSPARRPGWRYSLRTGADGAGGSLRADANRGGAGDAEYTAGGGGSLRGFSSTAGPR